MPPKNYNNLKNKLSVKTRAWINFGNQFVLGKGRVELLSGIDRLGSISGAAHAIGVSYKAAWNWIKAMNKAVGKQLVDTKAGGTKGGGAVLTDEGKSLLNAYNLLIKKIRKFETKTTLELQKLMGSK